MLSKIIQSLPNNQSREQTFKKKFGEYSHLRCKNCRIFSFSWENIILIIFIIANAKKNKEAKSVWLRPKTYLIAKGIKFFKSRTKQMRILLAGVINQMNSSLRMLESLLTP